MHYDHIVIGAGSMGAAAGYYLANQGKKTLLLDSYNPPHDLGSHHGEKRLIRYAYGEGSYYVPFVLRAAELWRKVEQLTRQTLFIETGVVNIGPQEEPFIQNVIASAHKFQLPLEVYNAEQANKKWPGIQLPDHFIACYEPAAGILKTDVCIEAYLQLAITAGADLQQNSRVVKIDAKPEMVTIYTENGNQYTANSIVLSAGAWNNDLLALLDLELPIRPIRKTFAWYEAEDTLFNEQRFPGFVFQIGDAGFYGFPSINGGGLKVGRHDLGQDINPHEEKIPFGEVPGDREELSTFLQTFMPQVGSLKYGKTCMYSMTPDENFIIDTHPTYKNIAIAAGFSGHGFKFARAVGEALSELATVGKSTIDLSAFAISRFTAID